MFKDQAIHILKKNNQKITTTRLWIINQIELTDKPLNPYEMLAQDSSATIDISTIYRNLELFKSLGIVHKIHSLWWYMPCTHQHHQCDKIHDIIICNNCNNINETHIDIHTKKILWLSPWPVELSGHCESCEQKK